MRSTLVHVATFLSLALPLFATGAEPAVDKNQGHLRMALVNIKCQYSDGPDAERNRANLQANLDRHLDFVDKLAADGAEFIGFPELSLNGYHFSKDMTWLKLTGPEVKALQERAMKRGIFISFGLAELDDAGKKWNTQIVIDPKGQIIGKHHKLWLTKEQGFTEAGTEHRVFDVKGLKMGIATCADGTDRKNLEALVKNGAQLIYGPHANTTGGTTAGWYKFRSAWAGPMGWIAELKVHAALHNHAGLYEPEFAPPQSTDANTGWASGAWFIGPDGATLAQMPSSTRKSDSKEWILLCNLPIAPPPSPRADEGQVLKGHTGSVMSVAFSPDGKLLASSSRDRTIRLWNAEDGRLVRSLTAHTGDVYAVAFSPNGNLLASASADKTIRLWDVRSGENVRTLSGHSDVVRSVVFSPNGKALASGSVDKTVRLWDLSTGEMTRTLEGHAHQVRSVAFSPDGKRLASGGPDRSVRMWDADTGRQLEVLEGHTSSVEAVAWSPDGAILASSSADANVRLWDTRSGKSLRVLEGHQGEVDSIAFAPDGAVLASGSKDTTIRLWNPQTGALLQTLRGHATRVESLAYAPRGGMLASGGGGPEAAVRIWKVGPAAKRE